MRWSIVGSKKKGTGESHVIEKREFTRRDILRSLPVGAMAVGYSIAAGCKYKTQAFLLSRPPVESDKPQERWRGAKVKAYRSLGATGYEMSDISFGCAGLSDSAVVRSAVERGVNYFDTSPDYSRAGSERALGEGLRGVARDRVFLASKLCTPAGHLPDETPVKEVIGAVESSLRRLGTDYLDLVHIHACNTLERLFAPNLHEAFDRLKEAGKVRFLGVSSHTPDLERVMRQAVDSGRFQVIMVAYNFRSWPALHDIFADAKRRGVGVVAMKTLKGAYHTVLSDFTPTERESFAQAAFKWVLANQDVSGLVVSITENSQLDEYLFASGSAPGEEDMALLERYDRLIGDLYCRPGCGSCLAGCPYGVPIDDVLRYSMYYERYGRREEAKRLYAAARVPARLCAGCDAPCEPHCPFGLRIAEQLSRAHRLLV